jgi:hypothetical protein
MANYENDVTPDFLRWCSERSWDWLMALPVPEGPNWNLPPEIIAWKFLCEIEAADATRFFRRVTLTPREYRKKSECCYALVGGLNSGEWKYWTRRWAAMNDEPESIGSKIWSKDCRKPLRPILDKLFRDGQFVDIELRLGSRAYWPQRRLQVDKNGMPLDPLMLKALKTMKKPKPKKPARAQFYNLLELDLTGKEGKK